MINGLSAHSEKFLADINRIQDRYSRAQNQIATGYRVVRPSDDPSAVVDIMQITSNQQRVTQVKANLVRVKSEVDTAESTLQVSVQVLNKARQIAALGASSDASPETRLGIAEKLRQLHGELVGLSRTSIDGQFIFSGDSDQLPSYATNWSVAGGVDRLLTPANTQLVEDAGLDRFSISMTAQEIFDHRNPDDTPSDDNAFQVLYDLIQAFEVSDQALIDTTLPLLAGVAEHVNQKLAFFGTAQIRIQQATEQAEGLQIRSITELADRRDADVTQAILELSQAKTHQEAAFAAESQRPRRTLFDYLG